MKATVLTVIFATNPFLCLAAQSSDGPHPGTELHHDPLRHTGSPSSSSRSVLIRRMQPQNPGGAAGQPYAPPPPRTFERSKSGTMQLKDQAGNAQRVSAPPGRLTKSPSGHLAVEEPMQLTKSNDGTNTLRTPNGDRIKAPKRELTRTPSGHLKEVPTFKKAWDSAKQCVGVACFGALTYAQWTHAPWASTTALGVLGGSEAVKAAHGRYLKKKGPHVD